MDNFIKKYFEESQKKLKEVSSIAYWEWLYDFLLKNKSINDEAIAYNENLNGEERRKGLLISSFFSYLSDLSEKYNLFLTNEDGEEVIFFKYKDNFFESTTFIGQGATTFVTLLDYIPEVFIELGKELTEEEQKDYELIQYIIVNKDLNMSIGKTSAQVGHACQLCTENELNTKKYQKWEVNNNYKKIVLAAHEKELKKLEELNKFYVVKDCGFTEIPKNSLTAISLGILTRKEASIYIKRLQLLK